jgi:hypothetical protein
MPIHRVTGVLISGALVCACLVLAPSAARAQSDDGSSGLTVNEQLFHRLLQPPDPCILGQNIPLHSRVRIAMVRDVGVRMQSVRLRIRVVSDAPAAGSPALSFTGEALVDFTTLLSSSGFPPHYVLPITLDVDSATGASKVRYGEVLLDARVTIDPVTASVKEFKLTPVSTSCVQ